MSPKRLRSSPARRVSAALLGWSLGVWCGLSGAAPPEPPTTVLSLVEALRQADQLYEAGRLPAAADLYRRAAPAARGEERRRCFERLLTIYVREGRPDEAIRVGLEYQDWLREVDDRPRALGLDLDLGEWYLSLGQYGAAQVHLQRALGNLRGDPLPSTRTIRALMCLAAATERQGDRPRAELAWRQVEAFARGQLDDPRQQLDLRQQLSYLQALSECYRFQGRRAEAIPQLEQLLRSPRAAQDPSGQRDVLRLLAGHLAAGGRFAEAANRLRQALEAHAASARRDAGPTPEDRLTQADLACELAEVLQRQHQAREASSWRDRAARAYRAALQDHRAGQGEVAAALSAFWRLQRLYQRTSQYDQALQLTRGLAGEWGTDFLIEYRLKAEEGSLEILVGEFSHSRPLLREAVAGLERQSPVNLIELPRALLNLAVVELITDRRGQAEELGQRCLKLYQTHHLPDDLILVETYNLLGTCAAQDGNYAQAIAHFRAGAGHCRRLGAAADPQQSNLLLNIALVHQAQGELEKALSVCAEARALYGRFAEPDSLVLAALDAARASLLVGQVRIDEAHALTGPILKLCHRHGIRGGPLVIAALHCEALYHLHRRDFTRADQTWQQVQDLQGSRSPLLPRTLNYRALTHECQGQLEEARGLYEEARRLQRESPRAFPVTHFTTLWRLANIHDRQGRRAEARSLLEEAVQVVEQARLRTYGAAQQRAAFFAQFAPGFDQLVEWSVRDGDVAAAVAAAARGRSRTLLDQLLLAGVDPRRNLSGAQGKQLRDEEAALRRGLANLRARAQLISAESQEGRQARRLLAEFEQVQQRYAEVYREILNASPVYRRLAQPDFARTVPALRERIVGPNRLLLVYHVGRQRSYLLLLGGMQAPEAFPLMVPAEVAGRVAAPPPRPLTQALSGKRGLALKPGRRQPEMPLPSAQGPTLPLTQSVLRALVDNYLDQITDPDFRPTRGFRLQPRDPAHPLPAQRPQLLADVLLPDPVRQRIRTLAPECLVVIPDDALHKLPLEALVLQGGAHPTYVLDELPPLVYAPSVAILALLAERPAAVETGPLSLLTVADPAYPAAPGDARDLWQPGLPEPFGSRHPFGLRGELPRLRYTAQESERISRLFRDTPVTALRGSEATEKALVAALPGQHIVHIAVHGFADDRFGNQFGTLALTPPPPGQEKPEDDGFLSLHEIYSLPLKDCELAVLSACVTNVGPQQPLEAGATLASGFLAAGARRVVASHWSVDDESTAALMEAFFEVVVDAARRRERVPYAQALRRARLKVRHTTEWSAPFHWAPFVLVGRPE